MEEPKKRRGRPLLITFVAGFVLGVAAAIAIPKLIGPLLPTGVGLAGEELQGVVRAKQIETDRLLLTLPTARGTVLATFTADRERIDLLVQEGDSVSLRVRRYAPFVEDPAITRVITGRHARPAQPAGSPPTADSVQPMTPDSAPAGGGTPPDSQ